VADFSLTAKSPLNGVVKEYDGVSIAEVTGKAIVSIAIPDGGEKKLAAAMAKSYKTGLPKVGQSSAGADGKAQFLGMASDQMFALFDFDVGVEGNDELAHVADRLGTAGYFTNQSDSWVMLAVSGPRSRAALARICSLDLHHDVFVEGAVARTSMEHLGTIIFRSKADCFIIFSARSTAQSLFHAIEKSITNIL